MRRLVELVDWAEADLAAIHGFQQERQAAGFCRDDMRIDKVTP